MSQGCFSIHLGIFDSRRLKFLSKSKKEMQAKFSILSALASNLDWLTKKSPSKDSY